MKYFIKTAKADSTDALLGTGAAIGGTYALTDKLKPASYVESKKVNFAGAKKSDNILLISSNPKHGSGHYRQAESFRKYLSGQGYNSIKHVYTEGNEANIDKMLRSGKYKSSVSFTGGTSAMLNSRQSTRSAVAHTPAHLVHTDRNLGAIKNTWWHPEIRGVPGAKVSDNYSSVNVPDKLSQKAISESTPNANVKKMKGLISTQKPASKKPPKAFKYEIFAHGGGTGYKQKDAAKMIERLVKDNQVKGKVMLLGGPSADSETKKYLSNVEKRSKGKIHYKDSLPNSQMRKMMANSKVNMTFPGGTTIEELGALGKPTIFRVPGGKGGNPGKITSGILFGGKFTPEAYNKPISSIKALKGTDIAIQGSEIGNMSNYKQFKNTYKEFNQSYDARAQKAWARRSEYGQGAKDVEKQISSAQTSTVKTVKERKGLERLTKGSKIGIGVAGVGLAGIAYRKMKDK
ncbi:MAG: hypothetical protein H8D23_17710 [Candidatus Brocadiales bacterium]|nr:hypothetical protein [Candidatus Brocadiales bacterium]